jgi:hypothetical protein
MGNFSSNKKLAMATRHRTGALLLANNLMERLRAHPYGMSAPSTWPGKTSPSSGWEKESGPQIARLAATEEMLYYQQLSFKNASFVGDDTSDTDAAIINIYWQERGEQRVLSFTMLLRRQP